MVIYVVRLVPGLVLPDLGQPACHDPAPEGALQENATFSTETRFIKAKTLIPLERSTQLGYSHNRASGNA